MELNGVERGRDGVGVDAIFSQFGKRIEDQFFDFVQVLALHPFQSGREGGLAQMVFMATGHIFAQPGIQQGLLERRGWGGEQNVGQDIQAHASLNVLVLAQHPVDRGVCLGVTRVARIVRNRLANRPFKARLERNG